MTQKPGSLLCFLALIACGSDSSGPGDLTPVDVSREVRVVMAGSRSLEPVVRCGAVTCGARLDAATLANLPPRVQNKLPQSCCADAATSTCGLQAGNGRCSVPLQGN